MPHGLAFFRNLGLAHTIIAGRTVNAKVPLNTMESVTSSPDTLIILNEERPSTAKPSPIVSVVVTMEIPVLFNVFVYAGMKSNFLILCSILNRSMNSMLKSIPDPTAIEALMSVL